MVDDHDREAGKSQTSQAPPHSDGEAEAKLLSTLLHWLEQLVPDPSPSRKPPTVPLLTFADVVTYFTTEHPGDPAIQAGALLRKPHPAGQLMFQIFLNARNQMHLDTRGRPYGRLMVARSLDSELAEKFADVDLVIFR